MKTFVINLERSAHRRMRMQRQLENANIDFEFFKAVDGFKLTDEELSNYFDPQVKYLRELLPGEIGCFLSHYNLFKKIVEQELPFAMVFEDDVLISKHLNQLVDKIEDNIKDGDVYCLNFTVLKTVELTTERPLDDRHSIVKARKGDFVFGNMAYIITLAAARGLVENLLPIRNVIDDWGGFVKAGYIKELKIVFPHPVDINDGYSDIHEQDGNWIFRLKRFMINNEVPIAKDLIISKRKTARIEEKRQLIRIDGQVPSIINT